MFLWQFRLDGIKPWTQNSLGTGRFAWNNAMKTLLSIFLFQALADVLSVEITPTLLLKDVYVNEGEVKWTPTTENAVYTVEYCMKPCSKAGVGWKEVPTCIRIPSSSCNFSSIRNNQSSGCVRVRVRAETAGQTSETVEACSRHGESCSPGFSLRPGPGSMTIGLTRNSTFTEELADHAKHVIHFGKEGEKLRRYKEAEASETIRDLEEGQRYCAWVQYVYMLEDRVGPPRCVQCETTLVTSTKETVIIPVVVVFIAMVILVPVIACILIYHYDKIKKMMQFPYEIPNPLPEPQPEQVSILPSSEEHYDLITGMSPARR